MQPILQITNTEVDALDQLRLTEVLNLLLRAEGARARIPPAEIQTSLKINDSDGGIDARLAAPHEVNRWLPTEPSVWQFKAGNVGEQDIIDEVEKPGVRQALEEGATYCLVLGQDLNDRRYGTRKRWLESALEEVRSGASCRLLCAAQVAEWASEHPASHFFFGRPIANVFRLDQWHMMQEVHQIPFQLDDLRQQLIPVLRQQIAAPEGPVHLHVNGLSGVGKTRLALEVFDEQSDSVLYSPDPPADLSFFTWMAAHPNAFAVLVVDECDPGTAARLAEAASMSGRRLRLLTVGQLAFAGSAAHVYTLDPLDEATMLRVVTGVATTIGPEQARWIARVSRGYVKLATALAQEIAREGRQTVAELTASYNVAQIIERLIPNARRRTAMRGLALLTRVGWDGELASEGQSVAEFVGLGWNEMRAVIDEVARNGLVSKQGRYRYVTPEIVALWLAAELWRTRKDDLLGFLGQLSPDGQERMLRRLSDLAGLDEAASVVQEVLSTEGPFGTIDTLDTERGSNLFSILARGQPQAALGLLERLIGTASIERLLHFDQGRRNVVWTLEFLAWRRETFFGAARLLLRIGEAENESYGNNASGVWKKLFLTYVAGTEVPALERYPLLEEALSSEAASVRLLAVEALSEALTTYELGSLVGEHGGGNVPTERWRPRTVGEDHSCRRAALQLLDKALHDPDTQVQAKAFEVFFHSLRNLIRMGLVDDAIGRVEGLVIRDDDDPRRREAWVAVTSCLKYEEGLLSADHSLRLQELAARLMSDSLHDRLRRFVGQWSHTDWKGSDAPEEERPDYIAAHLADEVMSSPESLNPELPWLVSGEAENVHYFGYRLGHLDEEHIWLSDLLNVSPTGNDHRLLSNYLRARADAGQSEWVEDLLDRWVDDRDLVMLVFDATWRGVPSTRGAQRLISLVDTGGIEPGHLRVLSYGSFTSQLPSQVFCELLDRLARDTTFASAEAGLAGLFEWSARPKSDLPPDLRVMAWRYLEMRPGGASSGMYSFYWAGVARRYAITDDPVRLVRTILGVLSEGFVPPSDERFKLLKDAINLRPAEVWEAIGAHLLHDASAAFTLGWSSEELAIFDDLPPDILLAWAREDVRKRPHLIAQLSKPREVLNDLVRGLLMEYGPDSEPANILASNFASGVWSGSMTAREEQQMAIAETWLDDPEPSVQAWAGRIIEGIKRELPRLRIAEEERTV